MFLEILRKSLTNSISIQHPTASLWPCEVFILSSGAFDKVERAVDIFIFILHMRNLKLSRGRMGPLANFRARTHFVGFLASTLSFLRDDTK